MSSMSREPDEALVASAMLAAFEPPIDAPLPRRSFLTGRVLDPELHPRLRTRLARAMRRDH